MAAPDGWAGLTADERAGWVKLGRVLNRVQADMIHSENSPLSGDEFAGESLRRVLDRPGSGFVTSEYLTRVLDANRHVDRANGEHAEALLKREREEYARKLADIRAVLARSIRARVNEVSIPSRYRREGALIVADWLEGKS